MCGSKDTSGIHRANVGLFATTHWSVVLAASDTNSPNANDAQDLTQEFFARLLARDYLSVADRNKGKFRSFLLGSLEHFLAREWTKAHAQKRGGGQPVFSLDEMDAENRYLQEPAHELTPAKIFDRRWATTLLDQAMDRLREECAASGKKDLFE